MAGAMIVTPCPVCQMNVEVYRGQVNKRYGTKFKAPVLCLLTVHVRGLRRQRQG